MTPCRTNATPAPKRASLVQDITSEEARAATGDVQSMICVILNQNGEYFLDFLACLSSGEI